MSVLKVGLIGCGGMGTRLARECGSLEDAEITAVCDVSADSAAAAGKEFGAKVFKRYQSLLGSDVDGVIVATPNDSHASIAIAAAGKGKHIFCEKPMALKAADCRRMIAAADAAGVKLIVGQVLRLFPVYWKARQIIDSGELGKPFAISVRRVAGINNLAAGWRISAKHSGGVLYEVHVHELDMMRFMMGEAETVFATTGHFTASPLEYEDTVFVHLKYANGGMGSLLCGVSASLPMRGTMIQCEKGTIEIGGNNGPLTYSKFGEEAITLDADAMKKEDPYHHEVRSWVELVTKGAPPVFDARDGLRAIELADAAYRSARTGRAVKLSA